MKTLFALLIYCFIFSFVLITLYSLYLDGSAGAPRHGGYGENKASVVLNVVGQRSLQAKADTPSSTPLHRYVADVAMCTTNYMFVLTLMLLVSCYKCEHGVYGWFCGSQIVIAKTNT